MDPLPTTSSTSSARSLTWLSRAFSGDRGLTVGQLASKVINKVLETVNARWSLRSCDSVGSGARVKGRMRVENRGSIKIGEGLAVVSRWIPTEFLAKDTGRIEIGKSVWINYGVIIAARDRVTIGDRVMIGQHCIVSDSEFPDMPVSGAPLGTRAVEIGDDAWLAGRVTVRPGVKIGAGAVIIAGSVVESDIPAKVIAGGIPARPLSKLGSRLEDRAAFGAEIETETEPEAALAASATTAATTATATSATTATPAPASASASAGPPRLHGYLISDFTIDELANELRTADLHAGVGAQIAPFGQVTQTLMAPAPVGAADFAVVWTRPETAVPAFGRLMAFEPVDEATLRAEVDAFCALIERAAPGYRFMFVPTWTQPSWERGLGMLDSRKGGANAALARMNLQLMERLAATSNVFVLNAARWLASVGPAAVNAKAWYLGKMAIARPALAEAARDIRAALGALSGGPRKLLVLDLDDTLWGGIVGDVGWEGLRLGGLDGIGEAFVDFQKAVKDLKRRGVVLGIVSKNEESVALEAIRRHPAMVLKVEDFVGWRINWTDKARNILELTQALNLGLQSVVFIDDNPVERARVREALPEVYVPEWPKEEFLYTSALRNLRCFDAPALSREDLERTRMYEEESQREALRQQIGSIEEWLKTLGIKVTVAPISTATSTRAAQLLNKTNQLNLTTRRLTESELLAWAGRQEHRFWVVSVSDRMGDAGLTGLLGMEFQGDVATIVDFVLSCRVMGRRVEETMVHIAVTAAAQRGAAEVRAVYLPTAKNKPCLSFWQASGFRNESDTTFTWPTERDYSLPDAIDLDWQK
jgi:FkbH-like protein